MGKSNNEINYLQVGSPYFVEIDHMINWLTSHGNSGLWSEDVDELIIILENTKRKGYDLRKS